MIGKRLKGFILFLKKSVNWVCLINGDYQKNCAVQRFSVGVEEKIVLAECKKN